jgi:dTDP-4-amino-4,6-dideoxygalactose transaminase
MSRVYLSPPDVGERERKLLLSAFDSNWIAPLGPNVDAFEKEMADYVGVAHAVALSIGTAGLHLALKLVGVGPGDEVIVPTFTFIATAAAATYLGARPVFVDSTPASWNIDPRLLAEELDERAASGRLPAAVVTVDLYGQCADHPAILAACERHGVPVVEDAAEALGATYCGKQAGSFGTCAVFSFNGNKIMTTSGGGMLVSASEELAARARYMATQARDPVPHYQHAEVGFNYRMSNLLAAVGRGQLGWLDERIDRRRAVNRAYRAALAELPGIEFMPRDPAGAPTWWLTCITVDPQRFGCTRQRLMERLEDLDIESRPTWKPLHMQPAFAGCRVRGGAVAESIFERGLCLPSGSNLAEDQLATVVDTVLDSAGGR